ncbi:LCP family protein [Aphanothece sacrum]|uniref:Cell envelope-related transcriptional attenuator n=1 Tax=Aphanothece sacrum FPU1 TaxID=1920663 RepID=A0A401II23_APHSA|nr:LCP family protein [Aphanothece sacrum]GBF80965.1 hypothetical protein AsFPU1_2374 [Aphanothece sacrum FPU1]GBF85272.1 hypothetical protein AsFPU3_2331 [Aphanothece sacrum FPU3]
MANSVERVSTGSGFKSKSAPRKKQKPGPDSVSKSSVTHQQVKKKKISPLYRGLLWGMTFSCTAALSATVGAGLTLMSPLSNNVLPFIQQVKLPWQTAFNPKTAPNAAPSMGTNLLLPYRLSRPVNVLVLGIDRVLDAPPGSLEGFGGRSDTILLLRFDPETQSVKMLSVPRDSRVDIPEVGYSKINDANVHGGPALTARVLSKTLNDLPIDRYVRVTTDAFKELVNLVGGVEVYVPHAMQYEDKTQKLTINLEEGQQTLNGEQAEQFARFRKDGYGDIGRVQRQQVLLKSLRQKLTNPTIIPRIPQAISLLEKHIDTNMTWEEMLALVNFGRQLERDKVQMVMLPGRFSQEEEFDARSYWVLSSEGRDRVMQEYFGISGETQSEHSPNRVRIALQNGADDPALSQQVIEYLAKEGFHNVYTIGDAPELLRESEIIVQKGDLEAAQLLQTALGIGRVEASSTGDLDSQLTLRIGLDAKNLVLGEDFLKQPDN